MELYNLVRGPATRKDFFFGRYADAISQAVLYSMFLACARVVGSEDGWGGKKRLAL